MDKIIKNGKYIFPVIVLVAVAFTVVIALKAGEVHRDELDQIGESISESTQESESSSSMIMESSESGIPLAANEDADIHDLVERYYNAVAEGDEDTLNSVCDKVEEKDMLRYLETAKYIDHYSALDIYTKPGYEEGDVVTYIYFKVVFTGQEAEYPGYQMLYLCAAEDGSKYIKRTSKPTEMNEYVEQISTEADVVELINRVKVEYDNLMAEQPELLTYLKELDEEVNRVVGVELAKHEADGNASQEDPETPPEDVPEEGGAGEGGDPAVQEPVYAVASTTVNVRASDSEKAEKLGRLGLGEKIQVLEQLVNGWSRVLYEGKDAYIMSQYLDVQESAGQYGSIGTVKALDTINIRAKASVDSSKLGTLALGETADLIADEGEWCKINFNGQVAYVKSEYVEKSISGQ